MSAPRAEWRRAVAFAEIAETLEIATTDVCAAWSREGVKIDALYKRESADGILRRDVPDTVTDLTVESMMRP